MNMEKQPTSSTDQSALSIRATPRLSPYDVLVLVTTISFGIAKAVTTSNGGVIVTTTMEWISGVLLYLTLFFIGLYKSPKYDMQLVKWLFYCDCTTLLWQREALHVIPVDDEDLRPIVTGDRLAVSFVIVIFGFAKATASYRGLNTTANSFDCVSGVVFASLTYCLEMYTEGTPKSWPSFFMTNYEPYLSSSLPIIGSCAIGILAFGLFSAGWTMFWYIMLLPYPYIGPLHGYGNRRPTIIQDFHDLNLWLTTPSVIIVTIALGLLGFALVVVPLLGNIRLFVRVIQSLMRAIRPHIGRLLPLSIRQNPTSPINSFFQRINSFWSRYFVHIITLVYAITYLGMAAAAILSIVFLGFPLEALSDTIYDTRTLTLIEVIWYKCVLGGISMLSCFGFCCLLLPLLGVLFSHQ